jgi:uncharacterized membrane protein
MDWQQRLEEWVNAGLVTHDQADRIRSHESSVRPAGSGILTHIVWALGAVLLAAGILLLVSAHWDEMSPSLRFASVLGMIAAIHGGAATVARTHPALSHILHAAGTAALGAGVFLAGQIFNLAEHWPGGLMLWAIGACCGWLLLRHWSQLVWLAVLVPVWLGAEWVDYIDQSKSREVGLELLSLFAVLLSVSYLSLGKSGERDANRRALAFVGALALVPSSIALFVAYSDPPELGRIGGNTVEVVALVAAFALPLIAVFLVNRRLALGHFTAAGWGLLLIVLEHLVARATKGPASYSNLTTYTVFAAGSLGLVLWGLRDSHRSRINLGIALFAGTVLAFYFDNLYDKLGRGLGLVAAGLLFIGGGWWLERTRRRLVSHVEGAHA